MAYRLGWVLYWACLALAAGWGVFVAIMNLDSGVGPQITKDPTMLWVFGIPALVLYGIGRALRYVLSNE